MMQPMGQPQGQPQGQSQGQMQGAPGVQQSPLSGVPREELEMLALELMQRVEELEAMVGGGQPQGQPQQRGGTLG